MSTHGAIPGFFFVLARVGNGSVAQAQAPAAKPAAKPALDFGSSEGRAGPSIWRESSR